MSITYSEMIDYDRYYPLPCWTKMAKSSRYAGFNWTLFMPWNKQKETFYFIPFLYCVFLSHNL